MNHSVFRSTVRLSEEINVCIISASPVLYAFYVAVKLCLLHLLPAVVVLVSLLRPQTKVAKRFSSLFLGEDAVCEPGLRQAERPDLVTSHSSHSSQEREKKKELVMMLKQTKPTSQMVAVREDPHRRTYKRLMSLLFLSTTLLYLLLDLSYQVQSVSLAQWPEEFQLGANLATALLPASYVKQIINPVILLYLEMTTD